MDQRENTHRKKTVQPYFDQLVEGSKTFELRNDGHLFEVGDTFYAEEYRPDSDSFTSEYVAFEIVGKHNIKELLTQFPEADTLLSLRRITNKKTGQMTNLKFTVKSVYRRYLQGFGLAYTTKRFKNLDLQAALDLIQSEIQRDDIKEVSIEDLSKPVKNIKDYPAYEVNSND
jgi:hypothetical protein